MSHFEWINSYGFLGIRLFDFPSLLVCLLLILIWGYKTKISYNYQLILVLHCLLPFLLNGVLFEPRYMPDQFNYLRGISAIRSGSISFIDALSDPGNVLQASAFLALIPLPSPLTLISVGFYNTFIYIVLFFILYTNKVFTKLSVWFYLLFPSAALYSALSLRETLIFFFMTLAVLYARKSNLTLTIICLIPLYMIKFQNFFILTPIVIIYFIFKVSQNGMGPGKAFVISLISLLALLLSAPVAIPLINKFRVALFIEDGGDINDVQLISGALDFVIQGLSSGVYFLFKPFIWEAQGLLPLIQSFENTIILVFLYLITKQAWKKTPDRLAFWLLYLALSMSVYGLVVFNYGTAVRYRYPLVMIYVLFVCADCNIHKLFPKAKKTSF